MALPKITQPEFEITLPVIKRKIKFRPFLVKEEKILLVGKEGDAVDQMKAMTQVLKNVVISPKNFNPMDLTTADVEFLFLHLRAKSVDNILKLKYKDNEDEEIYDFEVNIGDIGVNIDNNRSYKVQLQNLTMELKDPSLEVIAKAGLDIQSAEPSDENMVQEGQMDNVFNLLAHCIVKVYDSEQVYDDFSHKEAVDFLKSMDVSSFKQIQEFYESAPRLEHTIEYKNNLGSDRKIVLRGLSDFF